jgi:hypothetical protein
MRGSTYHGVVTTAHSLCKGANFYCHSTLDLSLAGQIIQSHMGDSLANADDARMELIPERVIMLVAHCMSHYPEMRNWKRFWCSAQQPQLLTQGISE